MNLSSIRSSDLFGSFKMQESFISHTAVRCQGKRLENLEENIKSPWIRPEDMKLYSAIGVDCFKIDGRDRSVGYNLSVLKAYCDQSYDGNLLYLMKQSFPANIEDIKNNEKMGLFLDNRKMEGFINPFFTGKVNCDYGCDKCGYCNSWVKKSISTYDKTIDSYLKELAEETSQRMELI
jgi:collagenase-like PrtC family protease